MVLDKEKIKELEREEQQQIKDEPFMEWLELNQSEIELHFINSFPPEEQPLDDDTPDFMYNYAMEFDAFAREWYIELEEY